MEGFLNRGWVPILPGCDGIVGFPEGQLPPRAPRPFNAKAGRGGGVSAYGIGARKTLG